MSDLVFRLAPQLKKVLGDFGPKVGVILGSGLGGVVGEIEVVKRVSYRECEGLFVSTVPGHKGEFVFGFLEGVPVMCMNGRVHLYEGASKEQVLTPIRLMKALGCHTLILTNSSGTLRKDWSPGTLVLINDQINFTGVSVLAGPNASEVGPRFVNMQNVYDPDLAMLFIKAARDLNIPLQEGIYLGVMGPQYETPAEIRMFRQLGGDMLGMSTIHEVIAARHAGLRVAGLSLVTNFAAGLSDSMVNHQEVIDNAKASGIKLQKLIQRVLQVHVREFNL